MESFEWLKISNENDIDSKENFLRIKEQLINDTDLKDIIKIYNKSSLFKIISSFQKSRKVQLGEDNFFISEKHHLAFCILKQKGNLFDKELEITKKHYIDNKVAKEWKNNLLKEFHPDKDPENLFKDNEEIVKKINKMYIRMIGEA